MDTTPAAEMTDRQYEIADAIEIYLAKHEDRDYNASQLARVAKCTTWEAHEVLHHLYLSHSVGAAGRGGAWMRYRAHRHGEMNF